jgi:hypothetical protein
MNNKIKDLSVYAWVGEDELGSGKIGIKRALTPAGMIPLAGIDLEKMKLNFIEQALDNQGKTYNKRIYLCKFKFDTVVEEVGAKE